MCFNDRLRVSGKLCCTLQDTRYKSEVFCIKRVVDQHHCMTDMLKYHFHKPAQLQLYPSRNHTKISRDTLASTVSKVYLYYYYYCYNDYYCKLYIAMSKDILLHILLIIMHKVESTQRMYCCNAILH